MLKAVTMLAALPLLCPLLVAGSASAQTSQSGPSKPLASCSGSGCDNHDPVASGCDNDAVTIASQTTGFGTLQLRWSTLCRTNWVRITDYPAYRTPILKLEAGDNNRAVSVSFNASRTAGTHYGNMVYSPANDCADGLVFFSDPNDSSYQVLSSNCSFRRPPRT
jgi:hypothetical protein